MSDHSERSRQSQETIPPLFLRIPPESRHTLAGLVGFWAWEELPGDPVVFWRDWWDCYSAMSLESQPSGQPYKRRASSIPVISIAWW